MPRDSIESPTAHDPSSFFALYAARHPGAGKVSLIGSCFAQPGIRCMDTPLRAGDEVAFCAQ